MQKVLRYFNDNGLLETIKKVLMRVLGIFGLKKSETYILNLYMNCDIKVEINNLGIRILQLLEEHTDEFNKVKYFDFINIKEKINSKYSKIFIAMDNNKIIGYVCCNFNTNHLIHNMGFWNLNKDEAWIGPTYVVKNYRNRGVHRALLIKSINEMYRSGIVSFYTAINKNNAPSLKSFRNVGFTKIGIIKIRKILRKTIRQEIIELNDEQVMKSKFNN